MNRLTGTRSSWEFVRSSRARPPPRGALAFLKSKVIAEHFGRLVSSGGPTAEDEADAGEEAQAPAVPAGA